MALWVGESPTREGPGGSLATPLGSFRFDDGWILRRLNSNFIHVHMRQICPSSVLPMLQHAKGLTTVVVRTYVWCLTVVGAVRRANRKLRIDEGKEDRGHSQQIKLNNFKVTYASL